ncbi:hypothetical protein L7F22_063224 [Adiantum nelumboides]|nr:hypothetical protein [Adiantum nelumboides]
MQQQEGSRRRATLVLDTRGTPMSQVTRRQMRPEDYAVEVDSTVVLKQPHVKPFLERMAALFKVVAFTSYGQCMTDKVFDVLDPAGVFFNRRLFVRSCKRSGAKDLSMLGHPMA